jgi:DNA repair protein RadD
MEFKLRDYQEDAVNACMEYINSKKEDRPGIVVEPTAAGKSWIIAEIARRYPDQILVLQPSVELLKQNYEKFTLLGGEASLYSDSVKSKEIGHVTYAILPSIKTKALEFKKNNVKLVIIDECHYKISPKEDSMFSKFIKGLHPDKVIGLTATPFRLKNNSGGGRLVMLNRMKPGFFKHMIWVNQIQEMIERGYWTPSVDEKWEMDEEKLVLNSSGTEFTEESVKEAVQVNGINNKAFLQIRQLQARGKRKSILMFTDSLETCETFVKHIKNSAYVAGDTPPKERARIIEGFKSGEIQVVFNYGVLTTGFDHPELDCIIMGRPTNSLALFYQIYGRGVRIADGKEDFLFIDYCNNFNRLGHPRDLTVEYYPGHGWSLFVGDRLISKVYIDGPIVTKADLDEENTTVDLEMTFPFGKFKNKRVDLICKTKPWYINFLVQQDWVDPVFMEKVEAISKHIQIGGSTPVKVVKTVEEAQQYPLLEKDCYKPYKGPLEM